MEDEAAERIRNEDSADQFIFLADIQIMLSRYWVLSTYEALRIAKNSDDANPRLKSLHDRFRLVRIPMAKKEIAQADRKLKNPITLIPWGEGPTDPLSYSPKGKVPYFPVQGINPQTGSVWWLVVQADPLQNLLLSRRELSDELLSLYD